MMKSKLTKLLAVILIVCLLSATLAGCGIDYSDSYGDDYEVLTVLFDQTEGWTNNFSPFVASVYQFVQGFMFEPLMIVDSYTNEETMWLAEDIVSEDDNKTLTVYLREGIVWSDGEEFNADDVVFTFLYTQDHPEIDTKGDWVDGSSSQIESVTKIDDYTVQIVMVNENRFHRNTLFASRWMVPEHIWSEIDNPATYIYETTYPVVTGAFCEVLSFSSEMISIAANPLFWQAENLAVDELRAPQFNSNDAALALLASGSVDWAHIMIANIEETYVNGNSDNSYFYGMNDGVRISMNYMTEDEGLLEAFNSVDFKRAVSMSIDRTFINEAAVYGYLVDTVPTNTGLPPAVYSYVSEEAEAIMAQYTTFDIDAANALLDEAGFIDIDGDGYRETPSGLKVEIEIDSPAGWTDWNDGAIIAAEGMREIGINATAVSKDLGLVTDSWGSGDWDMLYTAYGNYSDIYNFYYTTIGNAETALTNTWWTVCQTNYINEDINALIATLPTAETEEEVLAVTNEIEVFFAENMINIPILYNGNWVVYSEARFSGWATEEDPFCNPALTNHDSKILQLMALEAVED